MRLKPQKKIFVARNERYVEKSKRLTAKYLKLSQLLSDLWERTMVGCLRVQRQLPIRT